MTFVWAVCFCAALSSGCSKNATGPDTIDVSPERLVFVANDSAAGPPGVYSVFPDGSDLEPLAIRGDTIELPESMGGKRPLEGTDVSHPRWSPDHSKIACQVFWAYDAGELLMLMNSDGSDKRVFSDMPYGGQVPRWSPSGKYILINRFGGWGGLGPAIVDSTGRNERDFRVASPVVFQGDSVWFQGDHQWGPTDDVIYSLGSVNRSLPIENSLAGANTANEIFSLDATTGTIIDRLTYNDIDEARFQPTPNGAYVAFMQGSYGAPSVFFVIRLEDGVVSQKQLSLYTALIWNWSSQGTSIVFAADVDPDPYQNQDYRIFLMTREGLGIEQITSFVSYDPDI